ncbi:hypothetical protein [Pseudoalteromonas sp. NCIMB_1079]|uniref:hypothetical protein n=1 Tax=Pseudoalteromonas sp. NCIMB 1079 TaxID=3142847 RepID=UPI00339C45AE
MENSQLRIERAKKHLEEIDLLISNSNPFHYIVETDTSTGERATFSRENKNVIDQIKIISGDVIHNLRTAIDNAYWDIVSKYVNDKNQERNIQFPFCEKQENLADLIKRRQADKVGKKFVSEITAMKPYKINGNKLFTLIHELDISDKHKFPTPVGDFTKVNAELIRSQVPDFPNITGEMGFGGNRRDVGWRTNPSLLRLMELGKIIPPTTCKFERLINVPVSVVFSIGEYMFDGEVLKMLTAMVELTEEIVSNLYKAASQT